MRRSHAPHHSGGYGDSSNSPAASNRTGSSYLERENDDLVNGLREKVAAVKTLSVNIGEEIRHHNKILKNMDDEFETGSGMLNRAMTRVKIISKAGYSKHLLYLLLFAFIVFFLIYVMYKFK